MVLSEECLIVARYSSDYNRYIAMGWTCVSTFDDSHGITWSKLIYKELERKWQKKMIDRYEKIKTCLQE